MPEMFCNCKVFPKSCLDKLVDLVKKNNGKAKKKLIGDAFFLSKESHKGQVRANKDAYFIHPLETAAILAKMGLSSEVVAAALMHDILEDTDVDEQTLKKKFGKDVFSLVDGVTKFDLLASESRRKNALKNLQNLLFATTQDPRIILIKLADKLHNLRTLQYLPVNSRKRIANEALLIYVPIAHRIGLESLAVELEDLAFEHARPKTFKKFEKSLRSTRVSKNAEINLMIAILKKRISNASFLKYERSNYSLFTKMHNAKKILDELNDSIILEVIVESKAECYSVLGKIHGLFPPLPNKVKDFIASPKPTFYSVLQTTVFGPKGRPVKIRILTREMNVLNNQGVVAYRKISGDRISVHMQRKLKKLGRLLKRSGGKAAFIEALREDFLANPIYVFTIEGHLIELAKKSTVLDFAFAAEPDKRAMHVSSANINSKRAGLGKVLESGNVVELFFAKRSMVKKDWIRKANSFVVKETIRKRLKGEK